ncbi:molybdopterin synthase catalytic subunit [Teleopsis dalmanni]|uniref:molybdopterin synthase catalytic subunit n=1 Tax=Teleopsis dalmanni TaxID=139649 RepID=UPI0018CCF8EC|nr:molybdopterin synthase catalytic subunit [Teleopsis dalmanni]
MNHILLTREPLDLAAVNKLASHDTCGAISLFVGTTRNNFDGKTVISLEYEAYAPMANKEMETICEELRTHWSDVVNIVFHHRIGLVPVGEASVVIAVSSPHRQSSLDAVSFAIEELKKRVPIWKKEKYDADESSWKENKESISKRLKNKPKLDLEAFKIDSSIVVPDHLVQIKADENEIKRRMECFIKSKRENINENNNIRFFGENSVLNNDRTDEFTTCARTDCHVSRKNLSQFLKVRRSKNLHGPQTKPDYQNTLRKLMSSPIKEKYIKQEFLENNQSMPNVNVEVKREIPEPIQERLINLERHLNIAYDTQSENGTKMIYERLKNIEDRLLQLEALSPEYTHFITQTTVPHIKEEPVNPVVSHNASVFQRKKYTAEELNTAIDQIENEIMAHGASVCSSPLSSELCHSQEKQTTKEPFPEITNPHNDIVCKDEPLSDYD